MTGASWDLLTLTDILDIADGVLDEVLVRDHGLLASAVARPSTTVFGEDSYVGLEDKAAALLHSLVRNHALVDGNKRLAWSACRVFHLINGVDLAYTVDEAESMVVSAAAGELDVVDIAVWLGEHRRG